jgi:phosphate:Na+ symporter
LGTSLNLEHAGDIIDKGLLNLAAKRIRRRLRFSEQELAEADAMHEHLLAQLRLAAVFMGDDLPAALRLVKEKEHFRELERAATEGEFARQQEGGRQQVDTSDLLLDAVRDLKRVEAHLAAIAHPLLERSNLLRPSRLVRLPRTGEAESSR